MPEALSLVNMALSCGNVNTALKEGRTPQNMEMKKRSPSRSGMSLMSECHHIAPARTAAVITWKTRRELKASCRLSLRLRHRRIENWLNQLILLWFFRPSRVLSAGFQLGSEEPVVGESEGLLDVGLLHVSLPFHLSYTCRCDSAIVNPYVFQPNLCIL